MKTLLTTLALVLAVGGSFADQVRTFVGRIVGGPPTPAVLTVTATPNFGPNLQPGDHVSWIVDVRNSTQTTVGYLLVAQTTSHLSVGAPQIRCFTSPNCPDIRSQTDNSGGVTSVVFNAPAGSDATISEDASIQSEGQFSVTVATAANSDNIKQQTVVATLPGQTGQATTDTSNSADRSNRAQNTTDTDGIGTGAGSHAVGVTRKITPGGVYQVGEGVTANFTFSNAGDAPQTIAIQGNNFAGLQPSDYRLCGPRCSFVVPGHSSVLWSVDAVITNDPDGQAPSGFSDTVLYSVGGGDQTSASVGGKLRGWNPWLWLAIGGAAVAAVAVATALAVNHARRVWWDNHISVHAEAHTDEALGKPDKIREYVTVHVEGGPAAPLGAIPIIRIDLA